ncbi:pseudouridine synthase, RluA family [Shuttleworthella sp. MSX8B]|uniref:RluA family pseudouridine synthase n=1 Tax=Shuttleworthella sp. MSX8B TaxID=936574 RepID=UPI00044A365E|nr:RluA family pseudouridine synthase [Shuttleworthia sp. MSX8B]EUB17527.1 pseudouridine synthase, RluA family [Shuttleworthia sp. MSX8B]
MQEFKLNCTGEESGLRIDRYLADHLDGQSRNSIQKLIEEGLVLVNGNTCRASYKLQEKDQIFVSVPDAVLTELRPERIPLDILYEDDQLLIVNKPKEMVVHPAPGHNTGTLVNAIMYHCGKELSGINGEIRPGIVHRIDMNTTGSLIVCKTDAAHRFIASQIKEHSVHRVYRAIVYGHLNPTEGTIRTSIGRDPRDRKKMSVDVKNGRQAITHYRELARLRNNFSYVEFELETGRTHQIRVHMASIGHPILGDQVYGPKKSPYHLDGQTLHAMTIGFVHPTSKRYVEFTAPLPEYFQHLLAILGEE